MEKLGATLYYLGMYCMTLCTLKINCHHSRQAKSGIVPLTCYPKFENALLLVQMSENYLKRYAL